MCEILLSCTGSRTQHSIMQCIARAQCFYPSCMFLQGNMSSCQMSTAWLMDWVVVNQCVLAICTLCEVVASAGSKADYMHVLINMSLILNASTSLSAEIEQISMRGKRRICHCHPQAAPWPRAFSGPLGSYKGTLMSSSYANKHSCHTHIAPVHLRL